MRKDELRQLIRQRKAQHLTGEQPLCQVYPAACEEARIVLAYSALPDEVPTQSLLDHLVAADKTVLLPRVVNNTDMELRHYTGRHDLQPGAYGIMEPVGQPFTEYEQIDVAIIPGMAFDREGHRLGRGKGYYDRFLSRVPNIYKIGLCFSWQLVDSVPTDEHDIRMDETVTVN